MDGKQPPGFWETAIMFLQPPLPAQPAFRRDDIYLHVAFNDQWFMKIIGNCNRTKSTSDPLEFSLAAIDKQAAFL